MDEPDAKSIVRNRRTDAMFVAAYGAVMWFVYLVVYEAKISEYAQGVLTLALGTFLGYLTAMYQFETGTTRKEQSKDAALTASKDKSDTALIEIAKAAPAIPAPNGKSEVTPAPMNPVTGNIPAAETAAKPAEEPKP